MSNGVSLRLAGYSWMHLVQGATRPLIKGETTNCSNWWLILAVPCRSDTVFAGAALGRGSCLRETSSVNGMKP